MEYEEVKYSRSKIEKVGKIIAKCDLESEGYIEAIPVVDNWRAAHAFPLDKINVIISESMKGQDGVLIVQRLKRVESIIGKLQRENNTGLYRMQDLGGCRVIVQSMEELYETVNIIRNGLLKNGQEIFKENDYVLKPREISGYRSYHIVVKYRGNDNYDGMYVEIQIRTRLQHTWATAVEIIDAIMEESLKIGTGSKKYMYFFKIISALFSLSEETPIVGGVPSNKEELIYEMYRIDSEENIREKLSAYNSAIKYVGNYPEQADYYLLITDLRNKTMNAISYSKANIEKATRAYQKYESNRKKNCTDVVLVAGTSFGAIRESYPNYFMETLSFLGKISSLCEDYPEHTSIEFEPGCKGVKFGELFDVEYCDIFFPESVQYSINGIGVVDGTTIFCPELSMTLEDSYLRFSSVDMDEKEAKKLKDIELPIVEGPAVVVMRTGASFFVGKKEWSYISQSPMAVVTCKDGTEMKNLKLLIGWLKSNICMWDLLYNKHSNSAYYRDVFDEMCLPWMGEQEQERLLSSIEGILKKERDFVINYNELIKTKTEESSAIYELLDDFNKSIQQEMVAIERQYIDFYELSKEEYGLLKQDVNKKGYFVYQGK